MIPAKRGSRLPVRRLRLRAWKNVFQTGEQAFGAIKETIKLIH
jgi:hypothetical protein